jgi:hypothetical protein
MARRSNTAAKEVASSGDRETTSGYFRRIFKENPTLLKKGTNPELLKRWLQDHPSEKEVPRNVQAILYNLKSVLRKKRRQRRAEKAPTAPVAVEATTAAPSTLAVPRRAGKGLAQIEERIDDCLAIARGMDREGLVEVIGWLRRARNEVIRLAGG